MDCSTGVASAVPVSAARYWTYRDVAFTGALPTGIDANGDHEASGSGVAPNRTLSESAVPAGICVNETTDVHRVGPPASRTRDTNAPA